MNLYNKYRPPTFDDVLGNDETVEYLKEELKNPKKCPHVFLLHGPTGTGKTTLARIIAKALNCIGLDFQEINSANFNGIDSIRGMYKTSKYGSIEGGTRVVVMDEVHKITSAAQDAVLKLFEDPPKNTYFILCTTDPNSLKPTLRGRCIELQMKLLEDNLMFRLLKSIVKKEGKKMQTEVFEQIIQDALGHPRNAIQILQRVINLPKKQRLKAAKQSAEELSQSIELCRLLINPNSTWHKVSAVLTGLKEQDAESIRRHVLAYAQSCLLKKDNPMAASIILNLYEPLYAIGFPGLVQSCYSIIKG